VHFGAHTLSTFEHTRSDARRSALHSMSVEHLHTLWVLVALSRSQVFAVSGQSAALAHVRTQTFDVG
jgi:hypothetical protein